MLFVTMSGNLNAFTTLILKQISWKTKTFFRKLEYLILIQGTELKIHHFYTKLPNQKPILKQIECWVQNEPITKNGVLFFWIFFFFSLRTSYKELMWCTNDQYAHILTFCKRWSFTWRCFSPVSILNETLPGKNEFYSSLSGNKISDMLTKFRINLEEKRWKTITICI